MHINPALIILKKIVIKQSRMNLFNARLIIIFIAGFLFSNVAEAQQSTTKQEHKKLNILLFTADDLDRNSLGCFGSKVADISPNIDAFAKQSIQFKHAYVNAAICVPSRAILASGLYSHNNAVTGFFKMPDSSTVPLIMEILRNNGYDVGILGKLSHSTPKANFKWDYAFDQPDLGDGRNPALYYQRAKTFLEKCKAEDKPFYFMVNSHDPHRPYFNPDLPLTKGEEMPSRIYKPDEITVPGFVSDLPQVRKELSYYYNSTRRLDDTFGKVMQALEESGYADNTLVIFLSDNGIAIPFAKANTYYASNRTPLLVRWPNVVTPNTVNDNDLIPSVDIMPTILDALSISLPQKVDGESFLPLLKNKKANLKNEVYSEIDYKNGGGPTPMRSVQNKNYLYIFNTWSDGERYYSNNNEGLTLKAMDSASKTDATIAARLQTYHYRKAEELYNLVSDPDCLHNLVDDKSAQKTLTAMRSSMQQWMKQTNDPLLAMYINRNNKEEQTSLYHKKYPETIELDKNKAEYSKASRFNNAEKD